MPDKIWIYFLAISFLINEILAISSTELDYSFPGYLLFLNIYLLLIMLLFIFN